MVDHTHLESEVQKLKTAIEELTVLNDLAVAASKSIDVDQMLDVILKKSIKVLKAEQGSISLLSEEKNKPFHTLLRHAERTNQVPGHRVGDHITGWVLKHKKPLLIEDLANDKRFKANEQEKKEIRSVLCVPIWCRAEIIGIILLINKKGNETFTSYDLRLLSIIAPQSGQLIHNSKLQEEAIEKKRMEQELAVARRIQMSLLPKLENIPPGIDVAVYFNPAEEVGGDYYDFLTLGENGFGVVVADVCGHGPPAAMVMTMVKGVLHSLMHAFQSADQSLQDINAIIARIVPKDVFITMVFLVFDLESRIIQVSNAGHNPILYYNRKAKSCHRIKCRGCGLNLMKKASYYTEEWQLNEGDVVFAYTDGLPEAVNDRNEMFGEDRVLQLLENNSEESSKDIVNAVKSSLVEFCEEKSQIDDILMLAMKVK